MTSQTSQTSHLWCHKLLCKNTAHYLHKMTKSITKFWIRIQRTDRSLQATVVTPWWREVYRSNLVIGLSFEKQKDLTSWKAWSSCNQLLSQKPRFFSKIHNFWPKTTALIKISGFHRFSHSCLRFQQRNIYGQMRDHLSRKVTPIFFNLAAGDLAVI